MYNFLKSIKETHKQLIKFVFIGIIAVLVDLIVYYSLLQWLPVTVYSLQNEILAKFISFLCGSFVTYNLNKFWTWRKKDRSNRRFVKFYLLYGSSLMMNVASNSFSLYVFYKFDTFSPLPYKYFIAFIIATVISAAINFTGQKFWVFGNRHILRKNRIKEGEVTFND